MIRISNPTSRHATQWVPLVVPQDGLPVGALRAEGPSHTFRVVRGFPAGDGHEQIFVEATLPPATTELMALVTDPNPTDPVFALSDWVSDDLGALMPHLEITEAGGNPQMVNGGLSLLLESRLRIKADIRSRLQGWVWDWHSWAYHQQDMLPFEMTLTFAGNLDELTKTAAEIALVCGEYIHIDYRVRKGMPAPDYVDGKWRQILAWNLPFGRAQQIDIQGALLCLPQQARTGEEPESIQDPSSRWESLLSRMEGPLMGCAEQTSGFGAFRLAPIQPTDPDEVAEPAKQFTEFMRMLNRPGNITDNRRFGLTKNPAQAGAQEDFGAVKGSMVTTMGHPESLYEMRYNAEGWAMRPEHNRELNGDPVLAIHHPLVRQWSHIPDPRQGTADLLGWPATRPWSWPNLGWGAMDDQHYSANLLAAAYHHTQSPVLGQIITDLMELDRMAIHTHGPYVRRMGHSRAVGRRLLAWSHFHAVGTAAHQDAARWLLDDLMGDIEHHAEYIRLGWETDPNRDVRLLSSEESKYGWVDGNGNLIRCWTGWGHAFSCTGAYAAWIQTGDERFKRLALNLARTITRYSFFQDSTGRWHCCYAVRTDLDVDGNHTGQPIDPGLYQVPRNPNVWTQDGFSKWTAGACMVLAALEPESADGRRARQIVHGIFGAGPSDWDISEWMSVAEWPEAV